MKDRVPPHLDTFEYKSVPAHLLTDDRNQISLTKLNELGIKGWEFVTLDRGQFIFKRVRSIHWIEKGAES